MRIRLSWLVGVVALLVTVDPLLASVADTRHNLSVSGPGTTKSGLESQICIFCHTPHSASPDAPLWNRRLPGTTYVPYSSSTAVAQPGQPTGASILCLSCHDGTIALGEVLSRTTPISMTGGITTMPGGSALIGTDLSHDHPVSFDYSSSLASQNTELADPATLQPEIRLDDNGQLQCTACHDAHNDTYGNFLVWPNTGSALCKACHLKEGWQISAHSTSAATWNGQSPDPWPLRDRTNVADNACENCHMPHLSTGGPRLLMYGDEQQNCSACHNGNVATDDVMTVFNQLSAHPMTATTLIHDPGEQSIVSSRHVECADCHNPHAARAATDPLSGSLANIRGISIDGIETDPVSRVYELCFRCHADSPNQPIPRTPRQLPQVNTRLEFQLDNPSFHPVAGPGRNPTVPSLIAPWTVSSSMGCVDCHNNNAASSAAGSGPEGPHGSAFSPILVQRYETLDNTPESASAYALCYNCHDRNSILNDDSFKEHKKHIDKENTPCNVCHDPHGVSSQQGNSINNSHLINFDTSVVFANSNGLLRFRDNGQLAGSCDLECHGEDHRDESYP